MLLRKLLYWSNYTVIRWQLLLTALAVWVCVSWLSTHKPDPDSPHALVFGVYIEIIRWTIFYLFCFSFFTALCAWGFFIYRLKEKKIGLQTKFGSGLQAEAGDVPLTITLTGLVYRPLLGSVRARMIFRGEKLSNPVVLDETVYRKKELIRSGISGTGKTELHDRGIYDVEEVQLQFCDMFRLIALPYTVRLSQQLYTLPQEQKEKAVKAEPNSTEEQTQRIEIPKRVEGEYINYKDFEAGDDVRRIVWKIYARSGQLVVRIPETMDPYASHLYFYASFYNGLSEAMEGVFETELLNRYKDKVRNLFEALQKNGFEVRIPYDQEVQKLSGMSEKKNDLFQVAAAHWQKDKTPQSYVQATKAAFVCLSALTPAQDAAALLNNLPYTVPVVFVRMSDAIASPFRIRIKNVFFIPEKQAADDLRRPWIISPLHSRLLQNERELLRMVQQRGNSWLIPASDTND